MISTISGAAEFVQLASFGAIAGAIAGSVEVPRSEAWVISILLYGLFTVVYGLTIGW